MPGTALQSSFVVMRPVFVQPCANGRACGVVLAAAGPAATSVARPASSPVPSQRRARATMRLPIPDDDDRGGADAGSLEGTLRRPVVQGQVVKGRWRPGVEVVALSGRLRQVRRQHAEPL